jgi:disulfide bond formation protein DsbB
VNDLLGRPEYLHVLVNPLLTHALPCVALGLLVALLSRNSGATRLALLLVLLSSAAVWPATHYGHRGYDRVKSMADETGGDWLAVHRYRAEKNAWLFYVAAAGALAALVVPLKWKKGFRPLAWLSLALAAAACAAAVYIAYPAGKIRHREFRNGPPPAPELQAAHAEAGED